MDFPEIEVKQQSQSAIDFYCDFVYSEQRVSRMSIRTMGILAKEDAAAEGTTHGDRGGQGSGNAKGPQASTVPPNTAQAPPTPATARTNPEGGQGSLLPPKPFMTPQMLSAKAVRTHAAGFIQAGRRYF